jgi:hypothetical protein
MMQEHSIALIQYLLVSYNITKVNGMQEIQLVSEGSTKSTWKAN